MCDFNPTVMMDAMQEAQIKLSECGVDLSRYCYKMSQTTFDKLCKYNKQVLVSWDESVDPKCFGLPVEVDEQISECKVLLMAKAVGGVIIDVGGNYPLELEKRGLIPTHRRASMRQFFRELFCDHHYEMTRWHWTHGWTGMEPRQIEAELKCVKCGKIKYWHITNPHKFHAFIEKYGDKKVW